MTVRAANQPHTSSIDRLMQRGSAVPAWIAALVLVLLLAGAWLVTYAGGGSRSAMPHLFYVPIVLATLPFSVRGSIVTALAATVLCGPLMPLDTSTGEQQPVIGWVVRALVFLVASSLAGVALALRDREYSLQLSHEVRAAITLSTAAVSPADPALVALIDDVLDNCRFHLVYQPVYSLQDGRLLAVEALTRFDVEPYRPPDEWFEAAAHAGRGVELELAAIELAIAGAADLPDGVALAVNASPGTVDDARMLDLVLSWSPRPLMVEITEHEVIADYPHMQATLEPLRTLGVQISVDDAGAGFASLRHIVLLAADVIKLDISLTQDLSSSPLRRALGGSLIEFAIHSDALLIVEGVEELADLQIWSQMGAHAGQGYLLARPGPLPFPTTSRMVTDMRAARATAR